MSTQSNVEIVPEWSLGDRLRKARTLTGMTVAEFADAIGVSDKTINNAEGDKRAVRRITLNAWAMATGVSLEWLESGTAAPTPPTPDPGKPNERLNQLTEKKRARARSAATLRVGIPHSIPAFADAA